MNDLIFYGAAILVAGYVFWVWLEDLRAYQKKPAVSEVKPSETPHLPVGPGTGTRSENVENPYSSPAEADSQKPIFPGATPVSLLTVIVAVGGAIILLLAETIGEVRLGIDTQQTKMTVILGLYTLAAAFIEELIFRGYLYYDRGSRVQLVASIVVMSLLFALIHPYLWKWTMPEGAANWEVWRGKLSLTLDLKAIFSTAIVFVRSLWFYYVRFWRLNPRRSLIPCFAAHLTTNLGVWIIKGLQGATAGWF